MAPLSSTAQAVTADAASSDDERAIVQTALDYIEGWYAGDAARMERSLHPELAKRIHRRDAASGLERLEEMSALALVQRTRRGGGTQTPLTEQVKEVTIFDRHGQAASAKIVASGWIDYLHLIRWNGAWVIVNVLWDLEPVAQP